MIPVLTPEEMKALAARYFGGHEGFRVSLLPDEVAATLPGDGRLQRFTNGTIYLNPRADRGVFAL